MENIVRKERKLPLMKTTPKSIIALIVCMATVITSISAGTGTACAAGKKIPLKAGFKGTEIILVKDLNSYSREDTKIKKLEKKWGKPSKTKKLDEYKTSYIWKKGKTSIEVINDDICKDYVGGIHISIKDKNGSLYGIKVGTKTDTALKKLKKVAGNKNTILLREGQVLDIHDNSYIAKGKPTGDGNHISVVSGYMPIGFELKNGKVSSMYWGRS